ncbi:claret isoform a [Anaeramoeba flamelloides]|uniref:Claret isoform a n=1 Tax=Anaeramoeba flamelloides TaxID=1746091 RepID=A0AAV7YBY2_9EUKA|nr:claret isoform a [Anaeramoeba flamelloides]
MEDSKYDVYVSGKKNDYKFLNPTNSKLPYWTPVETITKPKKIVAGQYNHLVVWYEGNKLELHHKTVGIKKYHLENEKIKDITCSSSIYFIVTHSGRVYSLAQKNLFQGLPLKNSQSSNWNKLLLCDLLVEKNLNVDSVACSYGTNFFLCKNGMLYGTGFSQDGRLGVTKNVTIPTLIVKGIKKIFSGPHGLSFFYITKNNELYASGRNNGKLGLNCSQPIKHPQIVTDLSFKVSDVKIIQTGQYHSILLTNKGKVYSTGKADKNGIGLEKSIFTLIPTLKDKFVVKLAMGEYHQLLLTDENELYGWGFKTSISKEYQNANVPKKINFPNLTSLSSVNFFCGSNVTLIYNNYENFLYQDFEIFYKNQKFTDCVLGKTGNEVDCHKEILRLRTQNIEISKIQKLFEEKPKKEINTFLKWIYCNEITDKSTFEKIFKSLDLSINLKQNTLQNDLLKLYKDQDSTDFNILVKDDDYDDEDESWEEIPVHKIILLARSGLFREMFQNTNKEFNSVKDYSGKSIESIEILIKFFYTDKIELTADDDPILIVEELSDAVEYYQLNELSNLTTELNKIKLTNKIN